MAPASICIRMDFARCNGKQNQGQEKLPTAGKCFSHVQTQVNVSILIEMVSQSPKNTGLWVMRSLRLVFYPRYSGGIP